MAIVAVQNRRIWTKQPSPGASIDHGNPLVKRLFSGAKLIASYSGDWINQAPIGASKIPTIVGTVSNYFGAGFSGQKTAGGGRHGRSYSGSSENISDFTIAAVVIFDSVAGIQVITATCSSFYGGAALRVTDGSLGLLHVGLIGVNFATVEAGVPYSIVLSRIVNSFTFSICDLRSGSINSGVVSDNNAFNAPTSGVFTVGHGRQDDNSVAGSVGQAIISKATLSPVEVRALAANPWQIYKRRSRHVFVETSGGGSSAALTGSAISTAVGSLAVSITVPLSGNSLTSTSGSLGPGLAFGLSGSAENLNAGTVSCSVGLELSGNSQAFTFGTVTVSSGYFASLTGSEQIFSSGSLSPEIELALSGHSLGFTQGTVVVGASYIVALTGLGQTLSSGTLAPEIELSINGQAQTLAFGIFSPDIQTTLTGRSMTLTPGTLSIAGGSGGIGSLDPATIAAIAAAIWSDPRAPTIAKLLAIKDG